METKPGVRRAARPVALGLVLSLLVGAAFPTSSPPVPVLVGGIQVNEPDHGAWTEALGDAGLNAVQVTLYARQRAWDGPELHWEAEHPAVVSEVRAARRAGLKTVLVMRVALEHGLEANRHLWHGMIWPRESHLAAWMDRYREFVLRGARLAAAERVDLFVIGNELSSMTSTTPPDGRMPALYDYFLDPERVRPVREALVECARSVLEAGGGEDLVHLDGGRYPDLDTMLRAEERVRRDWVRTVVGGDPTDLSGLAERRRRLDAYWRSLIGEVRGIYSGAVSYGANFDQYMRVGFWDALDAMAVTGYFPLSRYGLREQERRERMRSAWRGVAADLDAVAAGRPVVLLELGWTRRAGATVRPWSYDRVEVLESGPGESPDRLRCVHWAGQPFDPVERVDAMRALADVVESGDFRTLRGLLLWKLTTLSRHRAIEPFAVLLGSEPDGPDARLLEQAARIAGVLERRVATLEKGTFPIRSRSVSPTPLPGAELE